MSRSLRPLLAAVLALCALVAATALAACGDDAPTAPGASSSVDPVVLLVDGRPVRLSAVEAVRAEFRLGGGSDERARAEEEAVRRELMRGEAEKVGVSADPAEVEARRDALVAEAGGEEALGAALEQVSITDAQLRSGLEDAVLYQALQDAKFGDLSATAEQARDYYDEHRADFRRAASAHLYSIQVPSRRIADNALGRLRSGRPFAEVARQFSTDGEGKAAGGDMGVVALASLPPSFTDALETTSPGEVAGPVEGPGGWYLLKATDLTRGGVAPFAEVRDDLVAELTRRQRYRALDKWLDAARERATVTRP